MPPPIGRTSCSATFSRDRDPEATHEVSIPVPGDGIIYVPPQFHADNAVRQTLRHQSLLQELHGLEEAGSLSVIEELSLSQEPVQTIGNWTRECKCKGRGGVHD